MVKTVLCVNLLLTVFFRKVYKSCTMHMHVAQVAGPQHRLAVHSSWSRVQLHGTVRLHVLVRWRTRMQVVEWLSC